MSQNYFDYRFCGGLRGLVKLGMWTPEKFTNESQKRKFYIYIFLCQTSMMLTIVLQFTDLYLVWGNFKKMTFNFCTSTIVTGIFMKMILLFAKRERLRRFHYNLWQDSIECNSEEDVAFLDSVYKRFDIIGRIFRGGPLFFVPCIGLVSYFSYKFGPRILPFAVYIPITDINDDVQYIPGLIFLVIMGIYVPLTVVESDLTMLGIMMQMEAHCHILANNLLKLDEVCEKDTSGVEGSAFKKEINNYLKNDIMLKQLKVLVKRHLKLLEYCNELEFIFNRSMAIQILGGSFLVLMNAIEATRQITNINLPLAYEILYFLYTLFDLYVICYHFTKLETAFTNIGIAAYSAQWYNMDQRIRKTLGLIITRAQKPPRFTYGKLYSIDVNAFMHLTKNIYSWLMLFVQLEMKQQTTA